MKDSKTAGAANKGSATPPPADPKGARERERPSISSEKPGGFKNDPDDPTNPCEAIERSRRKLRPSPLPSPPKR